MAILVRIHLPNRSEIRKIVRTKKDYFILRGDNYHIDFNKAYFTHIWGGFIKIACLDYEKGREEPIGYFESDIKTSTELRPHHVAEVIRRLIEEIPHFQFLALIFLIICMIICGIAVYFGYVNFEKLNILLENR